MLGLNFLLPEIVISLSAMLVLMFGVFKKNCQSKCSANNGLMQKVFLLSLVAVVVALYFNIKIVTKSALPASNIFFNGMFVFDEFAGFAKILLAVTTAFIIIITKNSISYAGDNKKVFEYPVLVLLSLAGMFVIVSASDFISMYVGIELMSLSLYVLTGIKRDDEKSGEAAVKYFVLGALSSCIILYGVSLIYGFSGATSFTNVAAFLSNLIENKQAVSSALLVGIVFVLTGVFFKLSLAPFHMWAPDVYEGTSKAVVSFLATAPKAAAFFLLARLLDSAFLPIFSQIQKIIIIVSAASMIVGAFAAVKQTTLKRLLAYSGVANMGYLLVGLASGNVIGLEASIAYVIIYVLTTIGVFAIITTLNDGANEFEKISDLSGLAKTNPVIAFSLATLMLSMAGIPPLAGFFGKFFVFIAALKSGLYPLAVIGILTSVVGAYYYLKIIKVMYFDEKPSDLPATIVQPKINVVLLVIIAISVLFNLLLLLNTKIVTDFADIAASSMF